MNDLYKIILVDDVSPDKSMEIVKHFFEKNPNFNLYVDPKCNWAINHLEEFPVEVNRAPYETLLRVPGIGVISARRILTARRTGPLDFAGLKKLGVVLKRAQYFLTCGGKMAGGLKISQDGVLRALMSERCIEMLPGQFEQISLFAPPIPSITSQDVMQCLSGQI